MRAFVQSRVRACKHAKHAHLHAFGLVFGDMGRQSGGAARECGVGAGDASLGA